MTESMRPRELVRSILRARTLRVDRGRLRGGSLEVHWPNRRRFLLLGDDAALLGFCAALGPPPRAVAVLI